MALTGGATTAACVLVLLALAGAVSAATPAPAPAVDCGAELAALSDCLDYVSPGSKSAKPSKTCCGEVKTAVGNPAAVGCLCAAMASKQTQLPINMTRVLALPTACGASASVFSKCHAAAPGGAPTEAPVPSPSSGSATASPPKPANAAAARSPCSAAILLATVATSLLAFYYL